MKILLVTWLQFTFGLFWNFNFIFCISFSAIINTVDVITLDIEMTPIRNIFVESLQPRNVFIIKSQKEDEQKLI